jgi:hypothetical protein
MLRTKKPLNDSVESLKKCLNQFRNLKSNKSRIVFAGTLNIEDDEWQDELKFIVQDCSAKNKQERETIKHLSDLSPVLANIYEAKTTIRVERKQGQKWMDVSRDFMALMKKKGIMK